MPKPSTSVLSATNVLVFLLLALTSCSDSDVKLPHVFSGNEVPPEVMSEPRAVPVPAAEPDRTSWPLVGTVPSKPRDFTPQPTIDATKTEMENDRNDAELLQHEYQEAPPVISTMAPPQP